MKTKKSKLLKFGIILGLVLVAVSGFAVFSEPGGTDDPVVTKSYIVDKVVPEIKTYVDQQLGIASSDGTVTARPSTFVVINLNAGQSIVGEAGTEFILRMGSGTVIATAKGGLADTTSGYDLANGVSLPSNHLLIIPVADGRGFKASTDAIVMIKGGYTVK